MPETTPAAITPDLTVEEVLGRHPAMPDAFAEAGFEPLLQPVMRRLFARATTLEGAARKQGWGETRLAGFLADLNRLVVEVPAHVAPLDEAMPALVCPPTARHGWGVFVDNRGLEAPQPMLRVKVMLETLAPGEQLVAVHDRLPPTLSAHLDELGWPYTVETLDEGACRLTITRA